MGEQMNGKRIGLRDVRQLNIGQTLWDGTVIGFGVRRQKSNAISYILKYRTAESRQRWLTIGRHGAPWTPDTARDQAKSLLGDVAKGSDPAADKKVKRRATTVAELCDLYLNDASAGRLLTRRKTAKTASTVATDRGRIECHIKPLLGRMAVTALTREDVDGFLHDVAAGKTARKSSTKKRKSTTVRGGKGAASRTVGLLGAIFTYAVRHRMRADNPVQGTVRFADGKRERRANEQEYCALGRGLTQAGNGNLWPPAIAAVRFLTLTGWRTSEVLGLRWDHLDLKERIATLPLTKTGRSIRSLSRAACAALPQATQQTGYVFCGVGTTGSIAGFRRHWMKIASSGNVPVDITPHVLRHSFASVAADLGFSELTIAALIGHRNGSVTSRYAHHADAVLLAAADVIANQIASMMSPEQPLSVKDHVAPIRKIA
jgi:integrase